MDGAAKRKRQSDQPCRFVQLSRASETSDEEDARKARKRTTGKYSFPDGTGGLAAALARPLHRWITATMITAGISHRFGK
jgi:hypothetical protein